MFAAAALRLPPEGGTLPAATSASNSAAAADAALCEAGFLAAALAALAAFSAAFLAAFATRFAAVSAFLRSFSSLLVAALAALSALRFCRSSSSFRRKGFVAAVPLDSQSLQNKACNVFLGHRRFRKPIVHNLRKALFEGLEERDVGRLQFVRAVGRQQDGQHLQLARVEAHKQGITRRVPIQAEHARAVLPCSIFVQPLNEDVGGHEPAIAHCKRQTRSILQVLGQMPFAVKDEHRRRHLAVCPSTHSQGSMRDAAVARQKHMLLLQMDHDFEPLDIRLDARLIHVRDVACGNLTTQHDLQLRVRVCNDPKEVFHHLTVESGKARNVGRLANLRAKIMAFHEPLQPHPACHEAADAVLSSDAHSRLANVIGVIALHSIARGNHVTCQCSLQNIVQQWLSAHALEDGAREVGLIVPVHGRQFNAKRQRHFAKWYFIIEVLESRRPV